LPSSAILLLEPDAQTAELIRVTLEAAGHAVTIVQDPEDVAGVAADHALVMIDLADAAAPDGLIARLHAPASGAQRLILAVAQGDDIEERIALIEAGADDVIVKPFDGTELEAKVEALLVRLRRRGDAPGAVGAGLGPAPARRRWPSTSPWPWPRRIPSAWSSSISTSNGARSRPTSTCGPRPPSPS
jgi:DNA-binding response OmpR family regulator